MNNFIGKEPNPAIKAARRTYMQKYIDNHLILSAVIDKIRPIDFELIYGGEEVLKLRQLLAKEKDPEARKKLQKDIELRFTPSDREKNVIMIENLLDVFEELDLGIMANKGLYYFFNRSYWEHCDNVLLRAFLGVAAERSGIPKYKARHNELWAEMEKQLEATAAFNDPQNVRQAFMINLLNGTLHIACKNRGEQGEVSELKAANKEDHLKYQLDFGEDPNATAPMFQSFLDAALPDKLCQDVLFEFLGYIFTDLKLEKTLLLQGPGGNGKSVVFEIVKALLGDRNICYHSMTDLCDPKGYHRVDLSKVLLNYSSELGTLKDVDLFKKLISGEPVYARSPYGEPFVVKNYCKFMFNVNNLPYGEQSEAFNRRYIILPFSRIIPLHDQDPDLHKKIISAELPGILNLVIEGLKRLTRQGKFTQAPLITEQNEKYKKESNNVQLFLSEEGYVPSLEDKMPAKLLYAQYKNYCHDNNYLPLSNVKFIARVEALSFEVRRKESQNSTNIYCKKIDDDLDNTLVIRNILLKRQRQC